jgi:hypothetical protein
VAHEPLTERALGDEDERLSLYPLSFEEAVQALLAVDPNQLGPEEANGDGDR